MKTCIIRGQNPKAQKLLEWHGNEEQMNVSVHHLLQSCFVQCRQLPERKINNELIFWPQQSYPDLKDLVSTSQIGLAPMIKVHTSIVEDSVWLEGLNGCVLCGTVCFSKRNHPEI